jgi:DNA-binding transcriptional ArsR family regulator
MTTGAHVRHGARAAAAPPHRQGAHGDAPDGAHDHEAVARLLHALAEPSRLAIVHLLSGAERRVVDLTRELGLAQSTVSAQLTTLREVGVVAVRREGRSSWYRLVRPEVAHLLADAENVALAPSSSAHQQPA